LPGQRWKDEIDEAIAEVDAVILCLSLRAVSKEGHINVEINRTLERAERMPQGSIFVIPLRIEGCDVPWRLSEYHQADYFAPSGYNRRIFSLAALAKFLERAVPRSI
jgi:hypothetical protein